MPTKQNLTDWHGYPSLEGPVVGMVNLFSPCACAFKPVRGKWKQIQWCKQHLPYGAEVETDGTPSNQ